jgi:starvation-inducible DNA-binding protein
MERLFKLLSDAQANLFLLFHKTWVYHWNVVGPDFHQFHTLFGEQYEAIFEEIDRLSEHMRYLNIRPVGTLTRIVEVSTIGEGTNIVSVDEMGQKTVTIGKPLSKGNEMIKQLLNDNQILIELLTEASEEADVQRSLATANLLQDLMESHGKFVWMLRSFTEKAVPQVEEVDIPVEQPPEQPLEAPQEEVPQQ